MLHPWRARTKIASPISPKHSPTLTLGSHWRKWRKWGIRGEGGSIYKVGSPVLVFTQNCISSNVQSLLVERSVYYFTQRFLSQIQHLVYFLTQSWCVNSGIRQIIKCSLTGDSNVRCTVILNIWLPYLNVWTGQKIKSYLFVQS